MPLEASRVLSSLLDVVSRLSHLLAKAGHVLEYLPEFLRVNKITALLDTPDFQQVCVHFWSLGKYSDLLLWPVCICLPASKVCMWQQNIAMGALSVAAEATAWQERWASP